MERTIAWTFISSVECKKVVSDILGEIEFLTNIKSAGKMTHFLAIMQVSTQSI